MENAEEGEVRQKDNVKPLNARLARVSGTRLKKTRERSVPAVRNVRSTHCHNQVKSILGGHKKLHLCGKNFFKHML